MTDELPFDFRYVQEMFILYEIFKPAQRIAQSSFLRVRRVHFLGVKVPIPCSVEVQNAWRCTPASSYIFDIHKDSVTFCLHRYSELLVA